MSERNRAPWRIPPVDPGDAVRACFGDRCLDARTVTFSADSEPSITLEVREEDLGAGPFDYAALIRVFRPGSDRLGLQAERNSGSLVFTGYVERVRLVGGAWQVEAAARVHPDKVLLAGTYFKLSYPEQFWSIARIAGVLADSINVNTRDPAWPPPRELWLVMMPIRGVRPKEPIRIGQVVITEDANIGRLFAEVSDSLGARFRSTGVWALVPVTTAMAFDAEQAGVEAIRHAVDRLALLARYAVSITPGGALRPFDAGLIERIELLGMVGAQTTGTERKWLRELDLIPEAVTLDGSFTAGLEPAARAADRQLDLATASWRRATQERDPSAAVVALIEALEFYVAGTGSDISPFTSEELRSVNERFGSDWTESQLQRLRSLHARLNEPSYGERLTEALARDGVDLSAEEVDLLKRIRGLRNDIVHGRARALLPPDDHRRALALVGRVLAFRAHALGSGADGSQVSI